MTGSITNLWTWVSNLWIGTDKDACVTARSVDERVRMAKTCALVKTPEAIQFIN